MTRVWALALAVLFLASHLPFLSPGLEDIDSLNFALGLRDFDPTRHQPHPPGYPLFIALGKLARMTRFSEPHALAVWGTLFGAIAIFALIQLFRAIEGVERRTPDGAETRRAALATVLTVACPLFWFTAVRPMSDVPGLATALVAQALFATAFWRQREMPPGDREELVASGRLIVLGSLVAALALGFRSQTIWLTAPPLMLVLLHRVGRGAAGAILGASMVFACGVLLWAVPLVIASGGPRAYIEALGSQAGEDFSGVDMLMRNPTPRGFAAAVINTLVLPWGSTVLGIIAVALSVLGFAVMVARAHMGLLLLSVLAIPYVILHLLLQETVTTRYALPVVPAMCFLIVRGLSSAGRRITVPAVASLAAWAVWIAVPAVSVYASRPSPVTEALFEMSAAARPAAQAPVLGMHYVFARAVQVAPPHTIRLLDAAPKHEWLAASRYWLDGDTRSLWFLADPTRTDLALIDPASTRVRGTYRWAPELTRLLSGVRPRAVDWIEIDDPGWFLMQGWDVTPETAGVARLDRIRPGQTPIVGYLRRHAEAAVLLIGGRNLDPSAGVGGTVAVSIDGQLVGTLRAPPDPGFFVQLFELPAGALDGAGRYARLEITAGADAPGTANIGIEQFNLQPRGAVLWGFDTGWHEQEFSPTTGRLWRWTSDHAETIVHHSDKDLVLTIAGESPLRSFDRPAQLTVRAGDRVLARQVLSNDFDLNVRIPSDALRTARDRLRLETDETFVPAERSENADRRKLGLRIWKFEMKEEELRGDRRR